MLIVICEIIVSRFDFAVMTQSDIFGVMHSGRTREAEPTFWPRYVPVTLVLISARGLVFLRVTSPLFEMLALG